MEMNYLNEKYYPNPLTYTFTVEKLLGSVKNCLAYFLLRKLFDFEMH